MKRGLVGATMTRVGRRTLVGAVGAAAVMAGAAGAASAQLLNLGTPAGLGANEGLAALEVADAMDRRATALGRAGASDVDRAVAALAGLARDLIREGEADGEDGSVRVVTGLAIAARLDTLRESFEHAPAPDGELAAAWVGASLSRREGGLPWRDQTLDRLLRDRLAGGTRLGGVPESRGLPASAWVEDASGAVPTLEEALRALDEAGGLDDDLRGARERVSVALAGVRESPAYHASAARVEGWLAQAAMAVANAPRGWVPERTRLLLAGDLRRAVDGLTDRARAEDAEAQLRRLALAGEIFASLEDRGRDRRLRTLREAVIARLDASSAEPAASLDALDAVERGVRELAISDLERLEPVVAAPVAVGWRRVIASVRASEERLVRELVRAAASETPPLADPSYLTGLRAHRAESRRFARFLALSEFLTGERAEDTYERRGARPRVLPEREAVARALLSLAPKFDSDDHDEAAEALAALQSFAGELARFAVLPAEGAFGDASREELVSAVTGGRQVGLAGSIVRARERWLEAWADAPLLGAARERADLTQLERTMRLVQDGLVLAEVLRGGGASGALGFAANAWPAWELPDGVSRPIAEAMTGEVAGLVGIGMGPAGRTAGLRLDEFERRHAVAIVLARIERGVRERGLRGEALRGAAAWYEFGTGTPDPRHAWLASRRDELAELCRFATELAHARRAGDGARVRVLEPIVADRAGFVLGVLASE